MAQAAGPTPATFDQYMRASQKASHFMGAVLVARNGRVLFARGYGYANVAAKQPNTTETEFRIGSNTKQFTAVAILLLRDRGKLHLNDSVCSYVEQCPADWRPITIYELLTHTSGIPNFTDFPNFLQVSTRSSTPEDIVNLFKRKPLDFKPGSKWSYSNSGYVLLGTIIEKISGQSYADFLQQNIFRPLGLRHTGYDTNHPAEPRHAAGYVWNGQGFVAAAYTDMSWPYSAGALYSTVYDLYRWDRALDAGKLLTTASLRQMTTGHVDASEGPIHARYGFGWLVSSIAGHHAVWHEGGIQGFTSINARFPGAHAEVIVLDNTQSAQIFNIVDGLSAILFGQSYALPQPHKPIRLRASALEAFTGVYRLTPAMTLTITRMGDQLLAQGSGQPPIPIEPQAADSFFNDQVGAVIDFKRDRAGKVSGLVLHQGGKDLPAPRIAAEAVHPKTVALSPVKLDAYQGVYQLAPGFALTIRRTGYQLTAQATGQGAAPIFPSAPDHFFYKVVDAQITFQRDASGKVTGLILRQFEHDMPAKRTGDAPSPPTAVEVAPADLEAYVGAYQLAPGFVLTITRSGNQLMAQATGQSALLIYPQSKDQFFYKAVEAQISFTRNASGKVTGLVLHQGGRDMPAARQ